MANPHASHMPEAYYQCAKQGDYLTACDECTYPARMMYWLDDNWYCESCAEEWLIGKDDMDIMDLVRLDKEIKRREYFKRGQS